MGANSFEILNNLDSSNGMVCRKALILSPSLEITLGLAAMWFIKVAWV